MPESCPLKAMILAAGFGSRLTPLTETLPKPMIPVLNRPLVTYNLDILKHAGFNEVMINTHYLSRSLISKLGNGATLGMTIHYSEEHEILGTGGGIERVKDYLNGSHVLIINADILANIDLVPIIKTHFTRNAIATMVLRKAADSKEYGEIHLNSDHCVTGILTHGHGHNPYMFTGIHILSPKIFNYLPAGRPSNIMDHFYIPALLSGERIHGAPFSGYWSDLGTTDRYFRATMQVLNHPELLHVSPNLPQRHMVSSIAGPTIHPPVLIGNHTTIASKCTIGPNVVIGDGCTVGEHATLAHCILWDNVSIPPGQNLTHAIVSPQHTVSRLQK